MNIDDRNEFYDIELNNIKDEIKQLAINNKTGHLHYPVESDYILAKNSGISEQINVLEINNGPARWEGRVITITKKIRSYSIILHVVTFLVSVSITLGIVYLLMLYNTHGE